MIKELEQIGQIIVSKTVIFIKPDVLQHLSELSSSSAGMAPFLLSRSAVTRYQVTRHETHGGRAETWAVEADEDNMSQVL